MTTTYASVDDPEGFYKETFTSRAYNMYTFTEWAGQLESHNTSVKSTFSNRVICGSYYSRENFSGVFGCSLCVDAVSEAEYLYLLMKYGV